MWPPPDPLTALLTRCCTCAVCGRPFLPPRLGRPRDTCLDPDCLKRHISACCKAARAQVLKEAADAPWERPIPPPRPAYPPPDPPRYRRLHDGTWALVVWAGDMRTATGVKGGLLGDYRTTGATWQAITAESDVVEPLPDTPQVKKHRLRVQRMRVRQKQAVARAVIMRALGR